VPLVVLAGAACADVAPTAAPTPEGRVLRAVQVAASPVVNTLSDAGDGVCDDVQCTLREALSLAASRGADGAMVSFAENLSGTIDLAGELQFGGYPLAIVGHSGGAGITVRSTNGRVAQVTGGNVPISIANLTLVGGPGVGEGGAIYNSGNLKLQSVTITGSVAYVGGAVLNTGTLHVENSTIAGNAARRPNVGGRGGGISNRGTLFVYTSTISGNVADDAAGGTYGSGGGIDATTAGATTTVTYSIIAGNSAADGPDIAHTHTNSMSLGRSIVGDGSGSGYPDGAGRSRVGTHDAPIDVKLGPLAANGGSTPTMALLSGSPAIDFVPAGENCGVQDQRYAARPQGASCDVGAYELVAAAPPANRPPVAAPGAAYAGVEGVPVSFSGASSSDPDGDAVSYAWSFGDGGTATGATPSHAYADNGTYTATLTVADGRGGSDVRSVQVTVANADPTASFAATPPSVTQGQTLTLTLANAQDAAADLAAGLQFAFDCGTGNGFGPLTASASTSCSTAAAGARTVRGMVRDKDGGSSVYTAAVTVQPVVGVGAVTLVGPFRPAPALNDVTAGSVVAVRFAAALSSPGTLAAGSPVSVAIDCGTGAAIGAAGGAASVAGLRYDPLTAQYLYGWRTERGWAGACRRFALQLATGETVALRFRFR
jgi:CSLREA domain-containing protein